MAPITPAFTPSFPPPLRRPERSRAHHPLPHALLVRLVHFPLSFVPSSRSYCLSEYSVTAAVRSSPPTTRCARASDFWSCRLPSLRRVSQTLFPLFSCSRSTTAVLPGSRRRAQVSGRTSTPPRALPDATDRRIVSASSSRASSPPRRRQDLTGASPSTTSRAGADHRVLHCREHEVKPHSSPPSNRRTPRGSVGASPHCVTLTSPWRHPGGQRRSPDQTRLKSNSIDFKCQI